MHGASASIEALALRVILTQAMKDTGTSVAVLRDLNDGLESDPLDVLTGSRPSSRRPPWAGGTPPRTPRRGSSNCGAYGTSIRPTSSKTPTAPRIR